MRITRGVQYMLLAAFVFSVMKVCVKQISHIPAVEVILFRSIISLVISTFFIYRKRIPFLGNNKKLLLLRGMSGSISLLLYFTLLQKIPLAAAASMQYLSPIFAAVLGVFIVGEKVKWKQYLFFFISFIGVLAIQGFDARVSLTHLIIGVTSSLFAGLAYNFVRKLKTTEDPLVIILYFPLVTIPMAAIGTIFYWEMPVGTDWLYLILVGLCTQTAQYFLTKAYQLEEVSKVSIVNYTGLIYSIAFGFFIFGELYSWMSYFGMVLIVLGVILNIRLKK